MDNQELLIKMGNGDGMTVDAFTKLLHQIITKRHKANKKSTLEINKLADKALFLIFYMHKNSSTFSVERMKMKEDLQQFK